MTTNTQWALGIDGGGTKCHARLETHNGELVTEAVSGPANPAQDANQALESIQLACAQIQHQLQLSAAEFARIPTVLGLAGVSIPAYHQLTRHWQLPVSRFLITTDLHIACVGAHGTDKGAIIITGTGSSAFINQQGQHTILGGHGFQLGDVASGAWLGQQALQIALETLDGLNSAHNLTNHLCQAMGKHTTADIVASALHYRSSQYAQLAPVVIALAEHADSDAVALMQKGADYLTRLFVKIDGLHPERISLLGGLSGVWQQWLGDAIQQKLSAPLAGPAAGAAQLARQLSTGTSLT